MFARFCNNGPGQSKVALTQAAINGMIVSSQLRPSSFTRPLTTARKSCDIPDLEDTLPTLPRAAMHQEHTVVRRYYTSSRATH